MQNVLGNLRGKLLIIILYTAALAFFLYLPHFSSLGRKELNIYTFIDTINSDSIAQFERERSVRVNVKYYDTSGEFLAEIRASQGRGYDVLFPTDYTVELLRREGLLQKLDSTKIPNRRMVKKQLLHRFYDPENEYTIPYAWSIYGICYDKNFFSQFDVASWKFVFEPEKIMPPGYSVGVTEGVVEQVFLGAIYLFHTTDHINDHFDPILKLFLKQKPWVQNYSGGNYYYLLSSNLIRATPLESAYARRIMQRSDRFVFTVPKEGTLMGIENAGISRACRNVDLAHDFINYMLSEEQAIKTWENGFNPANVAAIARIERKYKRNRAFFPKDKTFDKLFLTHNNYSVEQLGQMWLHLKLLQ